MQPMLGATADELLAAFVAWARKGSEGYNVDKAFRRAALLAAYGDEHKYALGADGLDEAKLRRGYRAWGMCVTTLQVPGGGVVWAINVGAADLELLASMPTADTVQLFWFLVHKLALDRDVQANGLVIVENMNNVGFFEARAWLKDIQNDVLQLTQGMSPIKVKKILLLEQPWYAPPPPFRQEAQRP